MSAVPAPHYFSPEVRERTCAPSLLRELSIVPAWNQYRELFRNAGEEPAIGEASYLYLWSPAAPARISKKISDARILVLLRDPAERAFSQYRHGVRTGLIRWSFHEHIGRNLKLRSRRLSAHYPFLELGLYAGQLGRYLETFGQDVWVGFYEDLQQDTAAVCREVFGFLGVRFDFAPQLDAAHSAPPPPTPTRRLRFWQALSRIAPGRVQPAIHRAIARHTPSTRMEPPDRRLLNEYYREDVRKLAGLVSRDLTHWLR